MNSSMIKILVIGILFVVLFLTGYGLSHFGKPYGTLLITFHKLIALADVVLLVVTANAIHRGAPLPAHVVALFAASVVLFAVTIVSGGLVSILATGGLAGASSAVRSAIYVSHKILPYLTLLSSALSLYLAQMPRP